MAKLTVAEFIDAIKELSVLELNELVKACEEEFGVSAAAGVVVAAAGAGAAAAEETSSHPLATAILNEIKNRGIAIPKHQECIIKVARGIETAVNKSIIRVGSQKYMEENNIDSEKASDIVKGMQNRGEIVIYVAKNAELIGVIGVSDPPRENIKKAIEISDTAFSEVLKVIKEGVSEKDSVRHARN